jgi:type I restriction enzyme S subunit
MSNKQKKMTPEVRFSGFNDDWELCKFEDSFNFPVSTNSLSRAMLNYDRGEVKSVHYGDVLIKYPAILNVKTAQIPFINNGTRENFKSNLLKNGDLIFADAAEDESVGKAVEVNALTDEYLVSGLHTIVARPKGKMAEFFLGYYINSEIYHRQLLRLMQGTKVSAISKKNLLETEVSFPTRIEEQEKIGNFFKQLDDTIALHHRKLELLKQLKKAYLQQMFPTNGEKNPKVRFANFYEDWEQQKFKNFSKKTGKKNIKGLNYPPYSVSNKVGLVPQTEQFGESRLDDLEKTSYKFVELNEFAYNPARINVGSIAFNNLGKTVIVSSLYVVLKMSDTLNNEFIFQYIKSPKFIKEVKRNTEGSVREYLFYENFSNIKLPYTKNIDEQIIIGKFLKQFNNIIAFHQNKIETIKKIKKVFLQKMFI